MISIEEYCVVIRCFSPRIKLVTSFIKRVYRKYLKMSNLAYGFIVQRFQKKYSQHFYCIYISVVFIDCISGDVETNPGPVNIIKTVCGTFHQRNIKRFGALTGTQCTCVALFSSLHQRNSVENCGKSNDIYVDV